MNFDSHTVTITFASNREEIELVRAGDTWQIAGEPSIESDSAAATEIQKRLGLTEKIPHDSRNIWVESSFGDGTITSRDYPPGKWSYVHGKRLVPKTSAATTLGTPESLLSLQRVLMACLTRVRLLTADRSRQRYESLPCLPTTLSKRTMKEDTARWANQAEQELTDRLRAASSPAETSRKLVSELNKMGHRFRIDDEDGSSWQMWSSGRAMLHFIYPDLEALEAGELPGWDDAEGRFEDQCNVSVSV